MQISHDIFFEFFFDVRAQSVFGFYLNIGINCELLTSVGKYVTMSHSYSRSSPAVWKSLLTGVLF